MVVGYITDGLRVRRQTACQDFGIKGQYKLMPKNGKNGFWAKLSRVEFQTGSNKISHPEYLKILLLSRQNIISDTFTELTQNRCYSN